VFSILNYRFRQVCPSPSTARKPAETPEQTEGRKRKARECSAKYRASLKGDELIAHLGKKSADEKVRQAVEGFGDEQQRRKQVERQCSNAARWK
jgi:hypothetical protein